MNISDAESFETLCQEFDDFQNNLFKKVRQIKKAQTLNKPGKKLSLEELKKEIKDLNKEQDKFEELDKKKKDLESVGDSMQNISLTITSSACNVMFLSFRYTFQLLYSSELEEKIKLLENINLKEKRGKGKGLDG